MKQEIGHSKSSGNVFADLGLDDADELMAKSELAHKILDIIDVLNLTQSQAAKMLGTHQTQISRLKTGEGIDNTSFDLLLEWLCKLDKDVVVTVSKKKKAKPKGLIRVAWSTF